MCCIRWWRCRRVRVTGEGPRYWANVERFDVGTIGRRSGCQSACKRDGDYFDSRRDGRLLGRGGARQEVLPCCFLRRDFEQVALAEVETAAPSRDDALLTTGHGMDVSSGAGDGFATWERL